MDPLTVFMGWNGREELAYRVAKASILRRASVPVEVRPIGLKNLPNRPVERRDGKLWCPISQAPMATEFAITQFVVPLIHIGWAAFVDCDIVCLADIADLFALADPRYAVQVVKHNHRPTEMVKMDGQQQTSYFRKNWSSVVLWNCDHPAHGRLTIKALNTWPGRDLHAFKWLPDSLIGDLPPEWNHLVGVSEPVSNPKILHYTLGVPSMPGYENCDFSQEWRHEEALERSPLSV